MDLTFLKSNRFWAIVAVLAVGILRSQELITDEISTPIILFLMSFVGIRTLDRSVDRVSEK